MCTYILPSIYMYIHTDINLHIHTMYITSWGDQFLINTSHENLHIKVSNSSFLVERSAYLEI